MTFSQSSSSSSPVLLVGYHTLGLQFGQAMNTWALLTAPIIKDCSYGAPHASRRPPQDHPCSFSFPVRISQRLGTHGELPHPPGWLNIDGLHPAGLEPSNCPAWRLKEEPGVISGLLDGGEPYKPEASGPRATPHCVQQTGRTWQQSSLLWEKAIIYRGN